MTIENTLYNRFGCEYRGGGIIFSEGEEGKLVYLILSGSVEISKLVKDTPKVLAVLSNGDCFGETALISERPRMGTARAIEDCRLLAIDSAMFFKIFRSDYDVTLKIIQRISRRIAEADQQLENLLFTDTVTRFVKLLEGGPGKGGSIMNRERIAFELGVPADRMQHIIAKLEEKGIVRSLEGGIAVTDQGRLETLKNYLSTRDDFSLND